jgi:putative FmdB family regulatory protein
MPTYEFRCPKGHDFEKFYRSIGAAPLEVTCPVCGMVAERQLSAGGGLVFKGSGFYITDYGKDGKKSQRAALAGSDSSSAESGAESAAKGDTGKTESKPGSESKSGAESKASGEPKTGGEPKSGPEAKSGREAKGASSESVPKPASSKRAKDSE